MQAEMGVLQIFSPLPSSLSMSMPLTTPSIPLLQRKSFNMQPRCSNAMRVSVPIGVQAQRSVVVRASSDIDGTGASSSDPPPEEKEEAVKVENLPLQSKLQLLQEAKLRMKLAKKIRLRRKRLVRKRQMRKKGRWPPSKMKKNKNV